MPPADDSSPPSRQVAVALSYDIDTDIAPKIAASGHGHIAEEILRLAFAKGIPVREDAALAEILAKLEIDSLIPLEAFVAVAEILSYIYRLNAASRPVTQT